MPPDIVGELLWPAIDFPASKDLEAFIVVDDEDAAWALAVWRAEGR
jgi:hypothetical protein